MANAMHMTRGAISKITKVDYEPKDNEYLKDLQECATYTEIKEWIKSEYGLKVSSLYVAQIKPTCNRPS